MRRVNSPTKSALTMACRRAIKLLPTGREGIFSKFIPLIQKSPNTISQAVRFHSHCCRTTRTLHTSAQLLVTKLLSVDELFAGHSLQEYLKKMETEYSESLRLVNSGVMEEQYSEEELRAKRSRVSLLAPLIQSIRELDTKHRDMAETEVLLKALHMTQPLLTVYFYFPSKMKTQPCENWPSWREKAVYKIFKISD
ncbi:hypothetical protein INR49_007675 [Caranx melampygus]|nr:hypothetical protein INR49_007675 [Caranx melampygus]